MKLTDECLAYYQTQPIHMPPVGWGPESGDYDHFVEVRPGDPRYPGPDTLHMEGALSPREFAASSAWCQFECALEIIASLAQYLPDLAQDDVPEGAVAYTEEDLYKVMRYFGWPSVGPYGGGDVPIVVFFAVAHWAFKKSDYWPQRLKTVDDFFNNFPTLHEQYDRYHAKVPDGKKPHDLGIGAHGQSEKARA